MSTEVTAMRALGSAFREQFAKQFDVETPGVSCVSFKGLSDERLGSFVMDVVFASGFHGVMLDKSTGLVIERAEAIK